MDNEPLRRGGIEMITAAQLAAELQVSAETLRRWRRSRRGVPSYKIGGQLRYRRDEIDAYIESRAGGEVA